MQDGEALNDPSSAEGREALEQVADLDPPDEIADDWQTLMDGIEVLSELGPDAPDTDVPEEVQDMGPASTNVFRYLNEECGLDVSG